MSWATLDARLQPMLSRVEPRVRRWLHRVLWLVVTVPVLGLAAEGLTGGLGANPIEKLEIETGEWALRLLAACLAISPLMKITRWGWLVAERRFLGLAAFFWALGHLSIYLGLDMLFDVRDIVEDVLKHLYITAGMLAFLLMVPLAITSTKGWIKRLGGRKWNALHRLVYVAAIAGCVHFLWGVKKDIEEPILYSSVFVVLFAVRLWWRRGATGRRATARTA